MMGSDDSIQIAQYEALERLRQQVHDQLGPQLVVAKLKLRPLLAQLKNRDSEPHETIETLQSVAVQLDQALQLCHSIVSDRAAFGESGQNSSQVVVSGDWLSAVDRKIVQSAGQKMLGLISTAVGATRVEITLRQEEDGE